MIDFRVKLTEHPTFVRSVFEVILYPDATEHEKAAAQHLLDLMKADTVVRKGNGLFLQVEG
jgi:hypothetical protein